GRHVGKIVQYPSENKASVEKRRFSSSNIKNQRLYSYFQQVRTPNKSIIFSMFSKKDIERYYDLSEVHYRHFWALEKSKSLHYGYWDATTKNFHEALQNINRVLSEEIGIVPPDHVLDAGCGVGGSSIWLAKKIGCRVTGISLSKKQIQQAKMLARSEKVEHLVSFFEKDYTCTGFQDGQFSVVWGIESVCYVPDKADFIKEAFRLLKQGGRLIIADFFKKQGLNEGEARLVKQWANGWAIEDYATRESFENKLSENGFSNIRFKNATPAIMHSARRLYTAYFMGMIPAFIYGLFHPAQTRLSKNNVTTAFLQYKTLKKGLWNYGIISAEKL
ncbi:MAG: methyltransferase domain-containing protein, partial [Ginsengibacter sp.]